MAYYIRILGTSDTSIHINQLIDGLNEGNLVAKFHLLETESAAEWTIIQVANQSGNVLAQIERNLVAVGKLGKEELDNFREEIKDCKPISAVQWLQEFFDRVKVIYAFQLLKDSFDDDNFPIISSIKSTIWNVVGGILQADEEGFSNEDGYHILWQFSDTVTGEWSMAVMSSPNKWVSFVMDLGSPKQKAMFLEGKVPDSTRLL